jgi:hypothetical protein
MFPKIAWSDMKSCENVYCMHSKDVHFISVDLPNEKSKHAYLIFSPLTTYLEKMLLHFIKKMDVIRLFEI